MDTLTEERLKREFDVTEEALKNLKFSVSKDDDNYKIAEKFLDTAQRYFEDAKFFRDKDDKASAFGALNYSFGWIDAGKCCGLFVDDELYKKRMK